MISHSLPGSTASTRNSTLPFAPKSLLLPVLVFLLGWMVLQPAAPSAAASTQNGTGTAAFSDDSDTLYFLIRVDDIYFRSDVYQGMNMPHNFTDFQEAVEAFGAKVTWGVIPHRLIEPLNATGHMGRDLRESVARGHEVSVHGYTHICPLNCEQSPWGHEMYCPTRNHHFTFEEQAALLGKSMTLLRDSLDLVPTSFIAPGHNLDDTTYEVLVDADLFAVSNFRHGTDGSYPKKVIPGLVDVPVHGEFTWALSPTGYNAALSQAIADVKERGEADGFYNLMLHDPFTRPGYYNGLVIDWMAELLDTLTTYYADRIQFLTLSEAAEMFRQTEVSADGPLADLPAGLQLHQNYPNPFNPVTVIRYELGQTQQVRLEAYDALGRKVALLDHGVRAPGVHEVRFDATHLAGGVYLYRLQTPEQTLTRRMLLVR